MRFDRSGREGLGLNTPSITSIPLSYPAELRYEPRVISGFRSVLEPSDAIEQELLDSAPNRFWGDRLKLQQCELIEFPKEPDAVDRDTWISSKSTQETGAYA